MIDIIERCRKIGQAETSGGGWLEQGNHKLNSFCAMVLYISRMMRVEKRVGIQVFCEMCLDQSFSEFEMKGRLCSSSSVLAGEELYR